MKDTNLPIKFFKATNHTKHKSQTDKQITGNAGMFYVCYHLSRKGWNVMPTARNARGIDILAYAQEGDEFLTVQVKNLSKKAPIPVGNNLHNLMANYWTVVVLEGSKDIPHPTVYVFTKEEILNLVRPKGQDSKPSYWISTKVYINDKYKERWDKITLPSPTL